MVAISSRLLRQWNIYISFHKLPPYTLHPANKRRVLHKRRAIMPPGGFYSSRWQTQHTVGEHLTRRIDPAHQLEWQPKLNIDFNDILLLLRGCCAQQKYTVLDIQSPDCSVGHPWDFRCNALAHTVTPVCSDSRLLTYKSTFVVLLREICADLCWYMRPVEAYTDQIFESATSCGSSNILRPALESIRRV